jgi:hypothetical protein
VENELTEFYKIVPGHLQSDVGESGASVVDGVVDGGSFRNERPVDGLEAARHHRHRAEVRNVHEGVRLPGVNIIKLFFFVTDAVALKARVFVAGKLFFNLWIRSEP